MDTGKRTGDDSQSTEEAGLKNSELTGGTSAIIMITSNDSLDVMAMVVRNGLRDSSPFTSGLVLNLACFAVLNVDGTDRAVL